MKKCLLCGKEFTSKSNRAKFCSNSHKLKYNRLKNKTKPEEKESPKTIKKESPEKPVSIIFGELKQESPQRSGRIEEVPDYSPTDLSFITRALQDDLGDDYYVFDTETYKRTCAYCGVPYETKLELNKYCSYEHYERSIHEKVNV